ncbi:hypothetical protein FHR87_003174 [Azomonas macrocytogenes]|uniref:Uncharacterized protein n=1 Tax=Azomonas macrocytogenes TaxID=69962 RepID=A0A839T6M1_AZOMA|nr:hypothetical protein [Azomonas macrocytogenes]
MMNVPYTRWVTIEADKSAGGLMLDEKTESSLDSPASLSILYAYSRFRSA